MLLKVLQYSQEITCVEGKPLACKPANLLKTESNRGVFLWILQNF